MPDHKQLGNAAKKFRLKHINHGKKLESYLNYGMHCLLFTSQVNRDFGIIDLFISLGLAGADTEANWTVEPSVGILE